MQERRSMTTRDKITIFISIVALLTSVSVAFVGWMRADRAALSNSEHKAIETSVATEEEARKKEDSTLEDQIGEVKEILNSVQATTNKTNGMVEAILKIVSPKIVATR